MSAMTLSALPGDLSSGSVPTASFGSMFRTKSNGHALSTGTDLAPPCQSTGSYAQLDEEAPAPPQEAQQQAGQRTDSAAAASGPAAAPEKEAHAKPRSVARLAALDAPRWVASVMIVASHFYQDELGEMHMWGSVWTQFFFVLSSFVLAYVEMSRPVTKDKPQPTTWEYVKKRLITVYPTYLLSVVISVFQRTGGSLGSWLALPLSVFLMQSWLPTCWPTADASSFPRAGWECAPFQWGNTGWFMSVLVIYWVTLRPLARWVRTASLRTCAIVMCACWCFSLVAAPLGLLGVEAEPWLTVALQFGPLGYAHVFLCGVAAARLFILVTEAARADPSAPSALPFVCRFGCCLGYLLFAAQVVAHALALTTGAITFYETRSFYWVMHNGGLLPVMVLIILGSACGADPIAKHVFQSRIGVALAKTSYSQYLLQFQVMDVLQSNFPMRAKVLLPFVLPVFAYLVERFFTRPMTAWQKETSA